MQDPEGRKSCVRSLPSAHSSSPAEFIDRIKADLKGWSEVAKAALLTYALKPPGKVRAAVTPVRFRVPDCLPEDCVDLS